MGITQHEIAALLGVTRSQYSLYELGLRSLPHEAVMRLSEMSLHFHAPDIQRSIGQHEKKREPVSRKHIESLIENNTLARMRLERQMQAMLKKNAASLHRAHLEELATGKDNIPDAAVKYVAIATKKNFSRQTSERFFDCELKLKMLTYEQQLLKEALAEAVK